MSPHHCPASPAAAAGFDLAPGGGGVTLPTKYDVKHAIGTGGVMGGGQVHHHHGDVHVHVHKNADVDKVADAIDRTINSQIWSRTRRAGLRGT